jgi:hypothetical protein
MQAHKRAGLNAAFISKLPGEFVRAYKTFNLVFNFKGIATAMHKISQSFPDISPDRVNEIVYAVTIHVPQFFRMALIICGLLFFARKKIVWFFSALSIFIILGLGISNLILVTFHTRKFELIPVITFALLIYTLRDINQPEIREEFGFKEKADETNNKPRVQSSF